VIGAPLTLNGIFGRAVGSVKGYDFSRGIKAAGKDGLVWNDQTLSEFLATPATFIKGNKMYFGGIEKTEDIEPLTAYLRTFSR